MLIFKCASTSWKLPQSVKCGYDYQSAFLLTSSTLLFWSAGGAKSTFVAF